MTLRAPVAALTVALLSCTLPPDVVTGTVLNHGEVKVLVVASNVVLPPGPDSLAVALDSAIQGAYLQRLCGQTTDRCRTGAIQSVDSVWFKAVLGGIHETTLRGTRSSCSVQSRTSSDTTTMVGIDRKFIVDNGYQIVITYLLTCPPPP